ncbi:NAD(+) synthase [Schaalia cardiffensis]|uniref:NAD(+) synthase n=1 Tax=Schaalia cardiffensis TaxID=181487 RepID=UPI0023F30B09|nr:NAD(+) synthase [Schaalia cardiffensis]
MNFHSLYDQGFARLAVATAPVHPAQPLRNAKEIASIAKEASERGVALLLFPELSLSGYAIDDLFGQDVLLDEVEAAIHALALASLDLLPIIVVGAPVRVNAALYNCAVVIHRGRILALIPKRHLPNYREFYEKRHFVTPGAQTPSFLEVSKWSASKEPREDSSPEYAPFASTLIEVEDVPGLVIGAEICEDMWVPVSPGSLAALAGASVICNPSASPITVGRAEDRRLFVRSASARLNAAYLYCAAGEGESTSDLAWDGQTMIYECGELLAEGERFIPGGRTLTIADVDLERILNERRRQNSFTDNAHYLGDHSPASEFARVRTSLNPVRTDLGLERPVDRFPFVPDDPARLAQDCYEAYSIQVSGLVQRLRAIGKPKIVIGVSGGLDSTHALIVAARAMDLASRPRTDILAYTLPGFATSEGTKSNALALCESLGIPCETIDITPAARQLLTDMGHPYAEGTNIYDVTFENVQAGLRTDYLFRIANHRGGIVLGTGDLSELALGWCTYGVGDQMSHYAVNTGVPKTMIQHLIRWVATSGQFSDATGEVLLSILATEISPELIPTKPGEKIQSTQDTIGPYNLQDFTLFHLLRRGARPSKIAFLAEKAWADASVGEWPAGFPEDERVSYSLEEIVKWERLFLRRFFSQQFKRSALPNGPKVMAGGSLSPRGDWRMPSDASGEAWIRELESAVRDVPGSGIASVDESCIDSDPSGADSPTCSSGAVAGPGVGSATCSSGALVGPGENSDDVLGACAAKENQ